MRVFIDGEPTRRFETEQLDALLTRSLEKSTMFSPKTGEPVDAKPVHPPPPPPAAGAPPRAPSLSGQFLTKGAPVLVLPEPPPAPAPAPALTLAPAPAPAPTLALALAHTPSPTLVPIIPRRPRPAPARPRTRRRPLLKATLKLALLAVVVACQPWWWNVGDVQAHTVTAPQK
ncbi:MAG TPA: hypothetical protein VIF09_20975 [Polyangiaceae bacterium]